MLSSAAIGVILVADLVRLAGRWAGHPRAVMPLPAFAGRLQAALMALAPGEPLMSADNLDSMTRPNVASGALPGLDAVGITAAALDAVVPRHLGQRARGAGRCRFDNFRAQARRR